jgi:hypothetical protein
MPQQCPQIAEFGRRHPNRRKAMLGEQLQQKVCVAAIVF